MPDTPRQASRRNKRAAMRKNAENDKADQSTTKGRITEESAGFGVRVSVMFHFMFVSCFGVRVSVMFHFMFVHYTFSSVWVAEWPPFGK